MRCYLGLGANLGDPARAFDRALARLERPYTQVVRSARWYGSAPMGPPDQPPYLNTVVEVETVLSPIALLAELKATERHVGRSTPTVRWGPREIDVDLLLYGDARIDRPLLTVPHAGISTRRFVLAPLAELAPHHVISGPDRTVIELLDALTDDPATVWLAPGRLDCSAVSRGSSPS